MTRTAVLLVEDNPGDARLLREVLADAPAFDHEIEVVERVSFALDVLGRRRIDVVLLDLTLPDAAGLVGLHKIHAAYPEIPVVVMTGSSNEALAIEAMQAGAQDYLVKGEPNAALIARSMRYAIERARSERQTRALVREQTAHATANAERMRLESLFTQAPAGICVLMGPTLRFDLVNPRYLEIFGQHDLAGKPLLEVMPELADQGFDQLLHRVMETGEPFFGKEMPCKLRRAGGEPIEVILDFVYEPLRQDDGAVEGVMVVATDVTEQVLARQRVEAARHETVLSQERFQLLVEIIPQIIWSTSPDGSDLYLSPRWYQYAGQGVDASLADTWRRVLHPDDVERCVTAWAKATLERSPWELQFRLRRHDGDYRWHLGRSVPHLAADGTVIRWYGTATDIDQQRTAIRSRDDLLATVSHDLRSPLAAISLAVEMIKAKGPSAGPKPLSAIERSATRMEQLIRDLLDMASIESGHLSVEKRSLIVGDLVEEAIESIQPAAAAKVVDLETQLAAAAIPVHCDRGRVLQVFSNILGNAVKFTPRTGKISVHARTCDADFVKFAITDTGPGIEPAQLPFVFDRFWQAKETARAGTGLGLAICKGIIQQHGGSIWVESQVGVGTTFFFTLPTAASAEER